MTLYFYDVETSGFSPRSARVMQFAGQRTDMQLKPIGRPDNFLIKLTVDVLPDPDAVLIHGISPQQTRADGLTEAEFLRYFMDKICQPDTIMVGYNNIRFDDEFMRFMLWRNFYDAYEWQWKNGSSKWDLLDVVRMTRALRPDGIKWPVDSEGRASNRLELVSSINGLDHTAAHDAISDVQASIAVARLLLNKQPKLFEYLLNLRDKTKVAALVGKDEPLLYTSGRYSGEYQKTTVVAKAAMHPDGRGVFVYDLRTDPEPYIKMPIEEFVKQWRDSFVWRKRSESQEKSVQFPVKLMSYNRCPAVAPLSVLDGQSTERLGLNMDNIQINLQKILKNKEFEAKIIKAHELMQPPSQPKLVLDEQQVDDQLYDGFVSGTDKTKMSVVRATEPEELSNLGLEFADERLQLLFPLYKARNFPQVLSKDEKNRWEEFRIKKLLSGGEKSLAARYFKRIEEVSQRSHLKDNDKYLLGELKMYGESVIPKTRVA